MQLIIVVESDAKAKTDYQYINTLIKHRYSLIDGTVAITPVYLGGKGNYSKIKEKIKPLLKTPFDTKNIVLFCYDVDDVSFNPSNKKLNEDIENFCKENNYLSAWFYIDIEEVFLGESVNKKLKKESAERFLRENQVTKIDVNKLCRQDIVNKGTSNILFILDKYLTKK